MKTRMSLMLQIISVYMMLSATVYAGDDWHYSTHTSDYWEKDSTSGFGKYFGASDGGGYFSTIDVMPKNRSAKIRKIVVKSGSVIDGLTFVYNDNSEMHVGGHGGGVQEWRLGHDEYITELTGCYTSYDSRWIISRLTFTTNKGTSFTGGDTGSACYSKIYKAPENQHFVAFQGFSGKYLDKIGPIYTYMPEFRPARLDHYVDSRYYDDLAWLTPFTGGGNFDFGPAIPSVPQAKIRKLTIRHGAVIDKLTATYNVDDVALSAGGDGGGVSHIPLEPNEHLTEVWACVTHPPIERVGRLTIKTSYGSVYSFGYSDTQYCRHYKAPENHHIIGFHGRSGSMVDTLGVIYAKTFDLEFKGITVDNEERVGSNSSLITATSSADINYSYTHSMTPTKSVSKTYNHAVNWNITETRGAKDSYGISVTATQGWGIISQGATGSISATLSYMREEWKEISVSKGGSFSKSETYTANLEGLTLNPREYAKARVSIQPEEYAVDFTITYENATDGVVFDIKGEAVIRTAIPQSLLYETGCVKPDNTTLVKFTSGEDTAQSVCGGF